MSDRLHRLCPSVGGCGENVSYGTYASGYHIVRNLLIDDGVPCRGHRDNLLNPLRKYIGVGVARHNSTFKYIITMDLANSIKSDEENPA
jgi:uncharacterized protein YkwD